MTAREIIDAVKRAGGWFNLTADGKLKVIAPTSMTDDLRLHREEIRAIVGSWVLVPAHLQSAAHRRKAIAEWNRDSRNKIAVDEGDQHVPEAG